MKRTTPDVNPSKTMVRYLFIAKVFCRLRVADRLLNPVLLWYGVCECSVLGPACFVITTVTDIYVGVGAAQPFHVFVASFLADYISLCVHFLQCCRLVKLLHCRYAVNAFVAALFSITDLVRTFPSLLSLFDDRIVSAPVTFFFFFCYRYCKCLWAGFASLVYCRSLTHSMPISFVLVRNGYRVGRCVLVLPAQIARRGWPAARVSFLDTGSCFVAR